MIKIECDLAASLPNGRMPGYIMFEADEATNRFLRDRKCGAPFVGFNETLNCFYLEEDTVPCEIMFPSMGCPGILISATLFEQVKHFNLAGYAVSSTVRYRNEVLDYVLFNFIDSVENEIDIPRTPFVLYSTFGIPRPLPGRIHFNSAEEIKTFVGKKNPTTELRPETKYYFKNLESFPDLFAFRIVSAHIYASQRFINVLNGLSGLGVRQEEVAWF